MKDCKFCDKAGLLILPLRYSVVVGDTIPASVPALPTTLGEWTKDIPLSHAKYSPRLLRNGYLYVLTKRSGKLYWDGYVVTDDSFLYKFSVDTPPQAPIVFSCDRNSCGIDASMISVDKPEFVEKLYMVFTPSAMTMASLEKYQANADERVSKGQMQEFQPSAWIKGKNTQKHSLLPTQLGTHVPEFILAHQMDNAKKSALGQLMTTQLYPAIDDSYWGIKPTTTVSLPGGRLGSIEKKMVGLKSAAFTLFDSIGITQELNNFRNSALAPVDIFLSELDRKKVDNQRKMEVMLAIDDLKSAIVDMGVATSQTHIERIESLELPDPAADNAKFLRKLNRIPEAEAIEARIEETARRRKERRAYLLSDEHALEKWTKKYESQLSITEIKTFRSRLETISLEASKRADARVGDHARWITSSKLVNAFESYDPEDQASGFCFTFEHSLCTFGMFGNKRNIHLLKKWLDVSGIEHDNLYMRSNFFNLKSLLEEAVPALNNARKEVAPLSDISQVQGVPWLKLGKGLIDVFKKTDSAWDEWLRDKVVKGIHEGKIVLKPGQPSHNLSKFHRSAEGLMFARIAEWTQALSTTSGKMDKAISGVVGMMLYTRLGDLAEKIGFDEYMLKIKPEKIAELKARQQKTAEYQAKADEQKRNAKSNIDKATRVAQTEALSKAKIDAEKVQGSIDELIRDEQKKVKEKVKITLDQLDKGARPTTNNFRQARLGVLLMSIESLSLAIKVGQFNNSPKLIAEITASILSLSSMTFDLVYAVAKSIREISPYEKIAGINKAADVIRGGLKLTAGTLSASAGAITAWLDITSGAAELNKEKSDEVLVGIYIGRAIVGIASSALGLIAAFSYSAPLLWRLAGSQLMSKSVIALRLITLFASSAAIAESLALTRTLMLIRLARLNMIGVAITLVEVGYRVFIKDDELENWLQSCTFRLDKDGWFSEKPFPNVEAELAELRSAVKAVSL
ncbi:hypothetical protein SAMN05428959_1143 [Duganella sp. CF517]|uniref:T6SS effector BTH_I2691 family protein n=1 Tax=Duganella sp. CF517 TaxID=1881038 RepID=UPI0008CF138E|nr:T6SS effector BTH_I2691 family protein [Duganella sp. CF517]SEO63385.1 hypothetical protein SAMN05428959_1143 [Duganella sp. CF517]